MSLIIYTVAAVASNGKGDSPAQENQVYFDQQTVNNARRRHGPLAKFMPGFYVFSENILPETYAGFITGNRNYFPFTAELSDALKRVV